MSPQIANTVHYHCPRTTPTIRDTDDAGDVREMSRGEWEAREKMTARIGTEIDPTRGSKLNVARPSAVRFDDVCKTFGEVTALSGVNLRIETGETVALLGPNGAGKSTAIAIMLGLHQPSSGVAEVLGQTPREAVASGRVGAMLQTGGLLHGVTVRELIGFVRGLYPRPMDATELFQSRRSGVIG